MNILPKDGQDNNAQVKKEKKKKKKNNANKGKGKLMEENLDDPDVVQKIRKEFEDNPYIPVEKREYVLKHCLNSLKVIVSNIPAGVTQEELRQYFDVFLTTMNRNLEDIHPFTTIEFSENRTYIIMEMANKASRETILSEPSVEFNNATLKIYRPLVFFRKMYKDGMNGSEYGMSLASEMENKIYMGNIPPYVTEDQIRKVCEAFGTLRSFQMARDTSSSGESYSKGYCFFEYIDPKATDKAIAGLNNLEMGDKKIKVQRAALFEPIRKIDIRTPSNSTGYYVRSHPLYNNPEIRAMLDVSKDSQIPSKVIQILNMFPIEELMEEESYEEIKKDITEEAEKYGEIDVLEIPRPDEEGNCAPGVGKIFIKFKTLAFAKKTRYKLNGKIYARRTIIASYYSEEKFNSGFYTKDCTTS